MSIMVIHSVDWNMISAIGTWSGSIATFLAVVVSLRQARGSFVPRLYAVLEYEASTHEVDGDVFSTLLTTFVIDNRGVATAKMSDLIIRDNRTWNVSTLSMSKLAGFDSECAVSLESGSRFQAKFLPVSCLVASGEIGQFGKLRGRLLGPCSMWVSTPLGKSYRVKLSMHTKRQISNYIRHQYENS